MWRALETWRNDRVLCLQEANPKAGEWVGFCRSAKLKGWKAYRLQPADVDQKAGVVTLVPWHFRQLPGVGHVVEKAQVLLTWVQGVAVLLTTMPLLDVSMTLRWHCRRFIHGISFSTNCGSRLEMPMILPARSRHMLPLPSRRWVPLCVRMGRPLRGMAARPLISCLPVPLLWVFSPGKNRLQSPITSPLA